MNSQQLIDSFNEGDYDSDIGPLFGKLKIITSKEKRKLGLNTDFHDILDKDGEEIATIWIKGDAKNKGCKRDLTFDDFATEKMETFIPYYKHKIFSEVLIEYVYKHTGVECDCIQYDYDFTNNYEEHEFTAKTKKYNLKKKKKIK